MSDKDFNESGIFGPFRKINRNRSRDEIIMQLIRSCEMAMVWQFDLMDEVEEDTKQAVANLYKLLNKEVLKNASKK